MRVCHCLSLLVFGLLIASPLAGQTEVGRPTAATISGLVTDSLTGSPLVDAAVQLVMTGSSEPFMLATRSGGAGEFAFVDVPEGEYLIGFLHPVLDSLGIEPLVRTLSVRAGQQEIHLDLAIPGPVRLSGAFCGSGMPPGGGLIIGFARAAEGGTPIADATVTAEWLELSIRNRRMDYRTVSRTATSDGNGRFVLCDVPSPGSVTLQAELGATGSDRFETDMPVSGFLRRDVYLGREAAVDDEWSPTPGRLPPAHRVRTGRGRLTGTVTSADAGWPLPGATVGIVDGEQTRTNARGQWVLTDLPSGTRVLEVRAPGYLSVNRAVDIFEGAGAVHVTLPRLAAVLDTLRVVARSRSALAVSGFEERRRASGAGRFITAEEIARRRLWETSHLFDNFPGLKRLRSSTGDDLVLMSSTFGGDCIPAVFINGQLFQNLTAADLDTIVQPREIAAMEVYQESQVPPEFQTGMSGCGSIVVWTK
jgi:hypothetical protein